MEAKKKNEAEGIKSFKSDDSHVLRHFILRVQHMQTVGDLCTHAHSHEVISTHQSCHSETLPSPDNAIKALLLHVTLYLLSWETNKLPPYLSQ